MHRCNRMLAEQILSSCLARHVGSPSQLFTNASDYLALLMLPLNQSAPLAVEPRDFVAFQHALSLTASLPALGRSVPPATKTVSTDSHSCPDLRARWLHRNLGPDIFLLAHWPEYPLCNL